MSSTCTSASTRGIDVAPRALGAALAIALVAGPVAGWAAAQLDRARPRHGHRRRVGQRPLTAATAPRAGQGCPRGHRTRLPRPADGAPVGPDHGRGDPLVVRTDPARSAEPAVPDRRARAGRHRRRPAHRRGAAGDRARRTRPSGSPAEPTVARCGWSSPRATGTVEATFPNGVVRHHRSGRRCRGAGGLRRRWAAGRRPGRRRRGGHRPGRWPPPRRAHAPVTIADGSAGCDGTRRSTRRVDLTMPRAGRAARRRGGGARRDHRHVSRSSSTAPASPYPSCGSDPRCGSTPNERFKQEQPDYAAMAPEVYGEVRRDRVHGAGPSERPRFRSVATTRRSPRRASGSARPC